MKSINQLILLIQREIKLEGLKDGVDVRSLRYLRTALANVIRYRDQQMKGK